MKILHYILGIPPVRGGGLVKYALDLINAQKNSGEDTAFLIPGNTNRRKRNKTKIVKGAKKNIEIPYYVIKNALPIPMANGIKDIEWYTATGDYRVYKDFLQMFSPDVIHIHSMMGVHANFFMAANDLKIPMILTTHDYFGLCPALLLVNSEENCEAAEWDECWKCCNGAFSKTHLVLEQSELYCWCIQRKCFIDVINKLACIKVGLKKSDGLQNSVSERVCSNQASEYSKLRDYYQLMFKQITLFHYNSSVAEEQYKKRLPFARGRVVPITNAAIKDNRKIKKFGHTLRVGYLGRIDKNKGYFLLQDVLALVYEHGRRDIELYIYTDEKNNWPDFVRVNRPYKYSEIVEVMNNLDVVAVPSLWRETFGFTALEAVSCGVPVIVTEFVGAKDLLIDREWGFCIKADKEELKRLFESIYDDRRLLKEVNAEICEGTFEFLMEKHIMEIKEFYKEALKRIG